MQSSGYETPQNPTGTEQSSETGQSEQPTAYKSMDTGSSTSQESSLGEEGQTTSRVNNVADKDRTDAEEESDPLSDHLNGMGSGTGFDRNEDAGNGAGSDSGRPPLPNGDTGYSG